jgi:hypothetical protein
MAFFPEFSREWEQGDLACAFYRGSYFTLVLGAIACLTARADIAFIGDEAS